MNLSPASSKPPPSHPDDCVGRVWVKTPGPIPTWQPVICPVCRPEASPLTPEGKLKDKEGLALAMAARNKGG